MTCSIRYDSWAVINVRSEFEPTEELRRAAVEQAVLRSAARGLFSLKDIWAEMDLFVKSDRIREYRDKYYSPYFIRSVLRDFGVRSIRIDCEQARGRRYYLPASSVSRGEYLVC